MLTVRSRCHRDLSPLRRVKRDWSDHCEPMNGFSFHWAGDKLAASQAFCSTIHLVHGSQATADEVGTTGLGTKRSYHLELRIQSGPGSSENLRLRSHATGAPLAVPTARALIQNTSMTGDTHRGFLSGT